MLVCGYQGTDLGGANGGLFLALRDDLGAKPAC